MLTEVITGPPAVGKDKFLKLVLVDDLVIGA